MNITARNVLILSIIWLSLIAARRGHAQIDDEIPSPITTLEDFRKARSLGDEAEPFPGRAVEVGMIGGEIAHDAPKVDLVRCGTDRARDEHGRGDEGEHGGDRELRMT